MLDLFEWLGKQRVTPIIHPGKLELEADVMGGGFPAMSQAKVVRGLGLYQHRCLLNLCDTAS